MLQILDFEDKLKLQESLIEEIQTYPVHYDATIVEEDVGQKYGLLLWMCSIETLVSLGRLSDQLCWSNEQLLS